MTYFVTSSVTVLEDATSSISKNVRGLINK